VAALPWQPALAGLAGLTMLRLLVAGIAPLSPDEAYYWVWSEALAPGYLDHPPMVALWIAAGTSLLGDGALGVRLLGPPAAALGSVLLAQAAWDLLPGDAQARGRAALLAPVLFNATLLMGVGAVTMTPDTPLLLFWTATLWALGRLHATGRGAWWLVAGLAAGLAGFSKYTAVLMGPAILVWLAVVPPLRPWLRRPHPWIAALLAFAVFAPVVAWNAAHGWVSFAKQAGRGEAAGVVRALGFLGELVAGQVGLATPIIAALFAAGVALAMRGGWRRQPGWVLLAGFSVFPALVFLQHALGARVQANWPGVIYPAAAIAACGLGAAWQRWVRPGVVLGFALTGAVWVQGALAPLPLPMRLDPTLLRLGGWPALADSVAAAAAREGASFVASDNYGHAALLARLLPDGLDVVGLEGRWGLFRLPDARAANGGQTGLLLRSARRADPPIAGDWDGLAEIGTLDRSRDGMVAEGFRLYRGTLRATGQPAAQMPRPQ
jgi:4-amino-4-deoxy-L-arabinose transferase-like glycosyltransferase